MREFNNLSISATVLLLLGALGGCGDHAKDQIAAPAAANVQATVITVAKATLPVVATAPGNVIAQQQAMISSRLMGFLREISVQEGEHVKAGQKLFAVDPTDIQGQVSMARAGLSQAEAALADAKNDYDRYGALYKDEAIPKMQWDKTRLQYQTAQQQVSIARASFETASSQMRYATVTAPFAGVITQKLANAGAMAAPGQPVLMLENTDKLQVQTQVSNDVYAQLKLGASVAISGEGQGGTDIVGTIANLVPSADPVTHSHLVKIDLPKDSSLRSGSFVQVAFKLGERDGLRVPDSAVLSRVGITGVFVVDAQGIAKYRMVRTGTANAGQVEILAGLVTGEKVVTSSASALQNGDKVVN
ncbi:efflux RND transporter periplasmic adaptor subunit [Rhodoferax sp.]|uniref:efflux RND transporter periplasmic adaptor subunit n=1 Tax=Rhodoferax sp. TaxID=50421 RepID=UPI0028520A92|nr:efflux RND transporter periplasmic adaptor subunit [Rhodoferax sp.]MDR3368458.1 efflux RND transporter periplasmic adaptor subunit [Rhodoferax sp.]